ncbi:MAG: helix-turn-helix transcriptional regulator [Phycisphaeraceae bacterium]|nr:helix-turn-helix transcriptional regulator [Phycisphaerales bacterium]MCB9860008.1 helix-turn-helix transcriptional regulator [Phycisphaeraceae bacterium]
MARKRPEQKITDTKQMRALSSSVRQEIIDTVNALSVCSIREIALALGCSADSLYYHIRALIEAGLLVKAGTRPSSRREELLVSTPTRGIMRLCYEPNNEDTVNTVARIVGSMLRVAERDFKAGFKPDIARCDGSERNLNASRQKAWLNKAQRREVNVILHRLQEIFSETQPTEGSELHSLTFVLAPIEPKEVRSGG